MQGMSERQYAAHVGLSRGAIQKAKTAERLVLYPDGSINAAASDARRTDTTDPSKTRRPPAPKLKPVPEAAVAARFTAKQAAAIRTLFHDAARLDAMPVQDFVAAMVRN